MLKFDAPLDFDEKVWWGFQELLPCGPESDRITVWVVNPSGLFIDDSEISRYPRLKILATPSTGTNHIDLEACKRRGIKVISLLDDREGLHEISASAEFTFMLLLTMFKRKPRQELQGKIIGLVGFGRIGRKLFRWIQSFEAETKWRDPKYQASLPLERIFRCDGVVICCSLTDETRGMITKDLICSMKPHAVLVNTARGEIFDEQGLYEALKERPDIRFGTDVVHGEVEGRAGESRKKLKELGAIVTNHIAGETFESRTKAAKIILELLRKEI